MKVKLHWAMLFALAAPSFVAGAEEDAKNAARVKWAKGVLSDFLDATRSDDWRQGEGLISPDLARDFPNRALEASPLTLIGCFSNTTPIR